MLKSLIEHERIETSETKAKELRSHADRMITMAKENTLASKRRAIAKLMVSFNRLTTKEARAAKAGDTSSYNADRKIIDKLFNDLSKRFATRNGGFTRIIKNGHRVGDNSLTCFIEFLPE
jgi:large subunit ribosomal protein L17